MLILDMARFAYNETTGPIGRTKAHAMAQANPVARYHLIEMALAARIREGVYDAGGLPGERALAEEFHAARVTIRSALRRLQDQGLVLRNERRGTVAVSGNSAAPPRLLREHVDKFLDRGRADKRKVLGFGFVAASPLVAEALRVAPGEKVLRVVRVRADANGPLTYTQAHVPRSIAHAVTRASLERKAFVQLLEDHGIRIGRAEQAVRSEATDYEVATALGIALGAPVLKLTRVLHDATGWPLQLLACWYRADRFQVRMELSPDQDATTVWMDVLLAR
jgi:GntR family transcriptional regulator